MDIYDLFSKFELDLLPRDWVQNLWKDDFSEAVEFPTEYEMFLENTDISELMTTASSFIREWLESADSSSNASRMSVSDNRSSMNSSVVDSNSWQNLISNNVQHKALVAMLSIFVLRGKTEKQFEVKRLGLIATDFYLMLLAIPGSQVFHIFNPILYSHAVENLKICSVLTGSSGSSKPAPKKRRGKHQDDDDCEDDEEVHNDSDDEGELVPSDRAKVVKLLNNVLTDLSFTLKRFQLKGQDDSLLITIQILILITRLERNSSSIFSKSPPHNSPSYLAYKAYKILMDLGCPEHGDVEDTVRFIMREMMSGFLIFDQKGLKLTPKEALVIKDHSINFVRNLLIYLKDSAFNGVYTLIQHIIVRIPDKADLRTKGVQVVIELLDVFPHSLYSKTVVWVMSVCHSEQAKYRITGLEIVTKLLYGNERTPSSPLRPFTPSKRSSNKRNGSADDEGEEEEEENNILTQQPDFSTTKYLLGTIFSRFRDTSSTVKAKALAIVANLISSNNRNMKHEMESIFVTPYLHADNIENSNVYEKNFFDFVHFLKNLKKETNPNVDPLPGAKAIIDLLEIFVEDEKVFVRKSALQVLANIFLMNEKWMSKKLLQVMVDNCRDMSVSVRKLLVQCLTDLLIHYPSHAELPKYWVMGVLPLLADQEIKSQEKVLEALQTTILDNLVAHHQMKTPLHALPWLLLGLIADHNKRKLFLFACHKWTLTNSLRQSLITIIKTHIGTENNVAAWFLLSSFSEYLDIKDPEFVMDYFYENVLNSQQVDEYCCQLVTETMHLSWRQLNALQQVTLCDNLLRHLSQFTVPLPLIGRCMDICQLITETHADSPEQARDRIIEWAGNLISICESRLEKVIGADSPTVVEDEQRLCQYIFTVGDAAQICPARLKHSSLLLIQNLLTGCSDECDKDDTEKRWKGSVSAAVQAVAVISLGKLCLQKEHTAKVLVPLFGSLLSETPHTEIKVNAMIALTDMCINLIMFVFIEFLCLEKCRGKTRKYNKATHQLNGRRDSAITLSTRPLDFDLCLRMGRGLR
ncbi:Condensin-2 complex subunit D3 [Homalodisca vitripennis]|nr:Condensin-2 complex subunit D3 [Homalodisca vitripennis]